MTEESLLRFKRGRIDAICDWIIFALRSCIIPVIRLNYMKFSDIRYEFNFYDSVTKQSTLRQNVVVS